MLVAHHKIVSSLPDDLEAGSLYFVRRGVGFDLYVTNNSGMIVAYPLNQAPSHRAGDMRPIPHEEIPAGWVLADGSLYSIAEYPAAFAVLGARYGGDGINTFAVPDMVSRAAVGGTPLNVGETGGSDSVTLTTAQLPSHNHSVAFRVRGENVGGAAVQPTTTNNVLGAGRAGPTNVLIYHDTLGDAPVALAGVTQSNVGGGQAVDIRNPYTKVLWIIALE